MDDGGVNSPSSDEELSSSDLPKTPSEWFERLCPVYMSYGMTYDEYWHGDNCLPRYYRKKHEIEMNRVNRMAWIQGAYVYHAILACSPSFQLLSKDKTPAPYMDAPIPLTKKEAEAEEERQEKKKQKKAFEAMSRMAEAINKQFRKGDSEDG